MPKIPSSKASMIKLGIIETVFIGKCEKFRKTIDLEFNSISSILDSVEEPTSSSRQLDSSPLLRLSSSSDSEFQRK